jgi:hypothetical protein
LTTSQALQRFVGDDVSWKILDFKKGHFSFESHDGQSRIEEKQDLGEAEAKYQQCIAANPNDSKAKAELDYVREQKAKRKSR